MFSWLQEVGAQVWVHSGCMCGCKRVHKRWVSNKKWVVGGVFRSSAQYKDRYLGCRGYYVGYQG